MKFFSVSFVPPEFTRTNISATSSSSALELIFRVGSVYMPRLSRSLIFCSTMSSSSSVKGSFPYLSITSFDWRMYDILNL